MKTLKRELELVEIEIKALHFLTNKYPHYKVKSKTGERVGVTSLGECFVKVGISCSHLSLGIIQKELMDEGINAFLVVTPFELIKD